MSAGPSLGDTFTLISGEPTTGRHNQAKTEPANSVMMVLVSLVLNILRIHPVKLVHILYKYVT